MIKSPFKFLDSYTIEDRDIFFGRDLEISELYRKVFESKILLVYGVSGTGKSSLINCGLASRFDDSDWLPVNVRRGNNIIDSLNEVLNKQAIRPLKGNQTISEKLTSIYLDHFKPVYLIFDQFEELFIFGDKEERKSFVHIIKSVIESDLKCRLIFSMREEYMAGVTEFEKLIPTFFSNRVRIEKMSHINALEAIEGPCKVAGINLEEGFAEEILEKLSPESADVELTYLQVFLDKIFHLAQNEKGAGEASINLRFTLRSLNKAGDVSDLLGSFLEEQIKALDEPDTGLTILKSFVSIKGTKKQLSQEEAIKSSRSLGKNNSDDSINAYLQKFVNLRILRDKDENDKYELRHDSLATKIYEKITVVEKEILEIHQFLENAYLAYEKRKILLNSNDLKYIAPYEDRLYVNKEIGNLIEQSNKESNKTRKRIKRLAFAGFISILIISVSALMAVYHLPFSAPIRYLGNAVYIIFFLPFFGYYVIKTRENRTMNLLFLIFTLIFLGYNYLRTNAIRSTMLNLCRGPLIYSDERIDRTTESYILKLDSTYNRLLTTSKEFLQVGNDFKNNADNLRLRTDEIINYIQDLKIEIIQVQEGPGSPALNGRDINVAKLMKLDDVNVPSEIMVGPNDNGKAFSLKKFINEYKDYLKEIIKKEPVTSKNIDNTLNTEDKMISGSGNQPGPVERWEYYIFQGVPSWFVITSLSQIQSDIRYSEAEVMSFLYNKMLVQTNQRLMNRK
jgi:hypothetical protein